MRKSLSRDCSYNKSTGINNKSFPVLHVQPDQTRSCACALVRIYESSSTSSASYTDTGLPVTGLGKVQHEQGGIVGVCYISSNTVQSNLFILDDLS